VRLEFNQGFNFFSSKTFCLKTPLVIGGILNDKQFIVKSFEARILNLGWEGENI
jgi:hypothetical protein